MIKNVGFAFDLHGTLVLSNDAWIDAFVTETGLKSLRDEIRDMVYRKQSRLKIAEKYGVCYEKVLERYHSLIKPDIKMCILARELANHYPLFLISSANKEKVERDIRNISMNNVFTSVYYKEIFCKSCKDDWQNLIADNHLDLLFYIGNDFEEDVVLSDSICVLLSGSFLNSLNELGMLYNRNREG